MIGIWSDTERLNKFMKSVQKWLEFHSSQDVDISPEIVTQAFEQGKDQAYEIISEFAIKDDGTAGFLQSWVELGLFAGFLTGWNEFPHLVESEQGMAGIPFALPTGDFYVTQGAESVAKNYALEMTDRLFAKLFAPPVSPLIAGLDDSFIKLLKVCYESSLYAGFLGGMEYAFTEKMGKFDPFDLKQVMS